MRGSVQLFDDRIRVEAQLFDATTGKRLWAHRYQRPRAELLKIQSVLMEAIVAALALQLSESERARLVRPATTSPRAYELYLRASQLDEDPVTMDEAERLYREAVGLDPWLAIAYTNLGNIRFRRQDADAAEKLYRKALEIDARQPEAQYNLGYVTLERGDPEGSIPLFLGAIQSDPKFADAYFNLAMAYEQVGDSQKARPHWKNYIQLEPTGTWTEIAKRHL